MRLSQPIEVLLIEGDSLEARRLSQILRTVPERKFRLQVARGVSEAQGRLEAKPADVLVVDISRPDAKGMEVVLAAQRIASGIPLVVLSGEADDRLAAQALQEGVQDFLVKRELKNGQLARALLYAMARQRVQASLRNLSLIDDLTGLHNRRGFITLAEQQLKLTARRGLCTSLIFVDVDGLKQINDDYGHPEGDRALRQVAQAFRSCFRESDIIARLGGDEFCALLIDASKSNIAMIRKRLTQALNAANAGSPSRYQLSVSMGIIEIGALWGLERQIALADASMYREKHSKRARGLDRGRPNGHAWI